MPLARLVKFIVLFNRSAGHYIKHDIRYALFIFAARKMRNSLEKLLVFTDIYALFARLPELNNQLLGIQLPRVERRIVGSDARPAFFVADALGAAGQQFIERNIDYLREYYQIVHRRLRVVALPLLHLLALNGALLRDIVAGQPHLLSEIIYAVSECHSINSCFFLIISNRATCSIYRRLFFAHPGVVYKNTIRA